MIIIVVEHGVHVSVKRMFSDWFDLLTCLEESRLPVINPKIMLNVGENTWRRTEPHSFYFLRQQFKHERSVDQQL